MSKPDNRLQKLYPGLTAQERARLVLQAYKEERPEAPEVRATMPLSQIDEFNRLIELMNATNDKLGPLILILLHTVGRLSFGQGWLSTLHLWSMRAFDLAAYIWLHTQEPVIRSEHARLVQAARAEMVPAAELAELLVERFDDWADDDLGQAADSKDDPAVRETAWKRVLAEKKKELTRLVQEGVLSGRNQGKRLLVNAGAFFDWLGEPTPVHPEWGQEFEVFPDTEAEKVQWLKEERRLARESFRSCPTMFGGTEFTGKAERRDREEGDERADEVAASLAKTLQECIPRYWAEWRAAQIVLDEVAAAFGGEDPLQPELRDLSDQIQEELLSLHVDCQRYTGDLELAEPDEALVEELRRAVNLPLLTGGNRNLTVRLRDLPRGTKST